MTPEEQFNELMLYTLAQSRDEFIHQHAVDAFGAQNILPTDRPIRLVFALVGLYLHVERGFNGRAVQRVHMKLANRNARLPTIEVPVTRGSVSIGDVLAAAPGEARNNAIEAWCASVWEAYKHNKPVIETYLKWVISQEV